MATVRERYSYSTLASGRAGSGATGVACHADFRGIRTE